MGKHIGVLSTATLPRSLDRSSGKSMSELSDLGRIDRKVEENPRGQSADVLGSGGVRFVLCAKFSRLLVAKLSCAGKTRDEIEDWDPTGQVWVMS